MDSAFIFENGKVGCLETVEHHRREGSAPPVIPPLVDWSIFSSVALDLAILNNPGMQSQDQQETKWTLNGTFWVFFCLQMNLQLDANAEHCEKMAYLSLPSFLSELVSDVVCILAWSRSDSA